MSKFSRREFLKDSVLFASAAAVLGDEFAKGNPAGPAPKVGPNDRIRIAVVGFNGRGRSHLDAFSKLADTTVATICDADSGLAERGARMVEQAQKTAPTFVQDIRRVLDDKSIDAISIATPNHWHSLASIWAIQAGKDVYVEKPVSHNVWEGRRVVDFARKHGRIVQTGTQSRSNEGMRQTIDYVHSGKIGKVLIARGLCYKDRRSIGPAVAGTPPDTVDYNLWLGPAPEKQVTRQRFHYDWHWFWDYGNGDMGNQGVHEMDKARWGLGKDRLCNAVMSIGGRVGYEDAGETANTQVCFFDYGDSQLIFEVRGLTTKDLLGAKVGNIWYGTDGYVVSTNYFSGAAFTPKGELIQKFSAPGDHYANFIKAVKSRKHSDLNADIEEGHLSSALCHLGNISCRLGSPYRDTMELEKDQKETFDRMVEHLKENGVSDLSGLKVGPSLKLDPKTERFVDHPQANAMLTRDYRKGFEVPKKA